MTSAMAAPAELLRRVVDAITSRPRCAGCERDADQDWQVMPTGGIYGLCSHCAERRAQLEAAQRVEPQPR